MESLSLFQVKVPVGDTFPRDLASVLLNTYIDPLVKYSCAMLLQLLDKKKGALPVIHLYIKVTSSLSSTICKFIFYNICASYAANFPLTICAARF